MLDNLQVSGHVSAFKVELKLLDEADLPLLCYWRNQPHILPYMDDPRPVSEEQLHFWLKKITRYKTTLPYIAYMGDEAVGYTELKEINQDSKTAVDGMFLFDKKYLGTGIGFNILICREIISHQCGLEKLFSHVLKSNEAGRKFVIQYGGKSIGEQGNYEIFEHEYGNRMQTLKKIASYLRLSEEFAKYFNF